MYINLTLEKCFGYHITWSTYISAEEQNDRADQLFCRPGSCFYFLQLCKPIKKQIHSTQQILI